MSELFLDPAYQTRSMELMSPRAPLRPSALLVRGVLALALAAAAALMDLGMPAFAIAAAAYLVTDGVASFLLPSSYKPNPGWPLLLGAAGVISGFATLFFPVFTVLGAWSVWVGLLHLTASIRTRQAPWMLAGTGTLLALSGVISVIFGSALLAHHRLFLVDVRFVLGFSILVMAVALIRVGFVLRRFLRRSESVPPFMASDFEKSA